MCVWLVLSIVVALIIPKSLSDILTGVVLFRDGVSITNQEDMETDREPAGDLTTTGQSDEQQDRHSVHFHVSSVKLICLYSPNICSRIVVFVGGDARSC